MQTRLWKLNCDPEPGYYRTFKQKTHKSHQHLCQVPITFPPFRIQRQGDFLGTVLRDTLTLFSLTDFFNRSQVACPTFMSLLRRSWKLKLYLNPIQNGSFSQNVFSLVPSYSSLPPFLPLPSFFLPSVFALRLLCIFSLLSIEKEIIVEFLNNRFSQR